MKILVACEESQRVCSAFRRLGHEAYSCDILECSGGHPEWHILCDVLDILNPRTVTLNGIETLIITFTTMDGIQHTINGRWDIIVGHPPCTYLSNAGACRLYPKRGQLNMERYRLGLEAKRFFLSILNADCDHIVVENPIPSRVFNLPPYSQIIQPFEYGEPYSKKTCLWIKGLPLLQPTKVLTEYKPYVSCNTSKNKGNKDKAGVSRAGGSAVIRSKTFLGIAEAIAQQFSKAVDDGTDRTSTESCTTGT